MEYNFNIVQIITFTIIIIFDSTYPNISAQQYLKHHIYLALFFLAVFVSKYLPRVMVIWWWFLRVITLHIGISWVILYYYFNIIILSTCPSSFDISVFDALQILIAACTQTLASLASQMMHLDKKSWTVYIVRYSF